MLEYFFSDAEVKNGSPAVTILAADGDDIPMNPTAAAFLMAKHFLTRRGEILAEEVSATLMYAVTRRFLQGDNPIVSIKESDLLQCISEMNEILRRWE